MTPIRPEEWERVVKGRWQSGRGRPRARGICLDSRCLKPGEIFWPIRGRRFDGHDFIRSAVKRGASGVVVDQPRRLRGVTTPAFVVEDTLTALHRLARETRRRSSAWVVAVTGSVGKTTTKELIARFLSASFCVLKSERSWNNAVGVPLTLLKIQPRHQVVVCEVGTNAPGEIAQLGALIEPDAAVLTAVGESHLEGLGRVEDVYREKRSIIASVRPGGTVYLNDDDACWRRTSWPPTRRLRRVGAGFFLGSDFRAEKDVLTNRGLEWICRRQKIWVPFHLWPARSLVVLALAVARDRKVPWQSLCHRLRLFPSTPGRFQSIRGRGMTIINDTYNANPLSMREALCGVCVFSQGHRRIAVLADMLELGPTSPQRHEDIGRWAARCGMDALFTYGPLARHIHKGFVSSTGRGKGPVSEARWFDRKSDLKRFLNRFVKKGDLILVKGSRAMKMEDVVTRLLRRKVRGIVQE